jgi:hypothetical protein
MRKKTFIRTPEFTAWSNMIQRCTNKANPNFKRYSKLGVCNKWLIFKNFMSDMGKKPDSSFQLERKNNEQGYSKENCIWTSKLNNMINRRSFGKSKCRGVFLTPKGRYQVRITLNYKDYYLGTVNTIAEGRDLFLNKYYDHYKKFPPEYIPVNK